MLSEYSIFKITEFSLQSAGGSGFSEHQKTWAFIHLSDADLEPWFAVIAYCNTLWYSSLIEESNHTKGVKHSLTLKSAEKSFYPVLVLLFLSSQYQTGRQWGAWFPISMQMENFVIIWKFPGQIHAFILSCFWKPFWLYGWWYPTSKYSFILQHILWMLKCNTYNQLSAGAAAFWQTKS